MAVTEHNGSASRLLRAAASALVPFMVALPICPDRPDDIRAQVSYVATALSSGNAADAMTPFDKSFANYDKLRSYFQGLSAFQVENEIEFIDENDNETNANLTVNWILTLTDVSTHATDRRTGDIQIKLAHRGGKWKIIDFAPITLFDPQQNKAPQG